MGLMTPPRVELVYSIEPDVLKPGVQAQTALAQLIKNEAAQRASRGESLFFRLNVAGMFEVSVAPHDEHISLPRKGSVPEFHVRRKDTNTGSQALEKQLENVLSETIYPNAQSQKRFARLAGLRHEKELALQMLSHFFCPEGAYAWGRKHNCEALVENLLGEPAYPVLILEGPPGVGKSELARTIADPLARALGTPVVSYSVSLTLRGHGLVGELTQNIAKLMEFAKMRHLERGYPCLLLIDEADAILQKRDGQQPQHHEEQVGVNQFLTEFDDLRGSPGVAIILTTNLHEALDDAVKKRTNAQWIRFPATGTGVRFYLLKRFLGNRFVSSDLRQLAGVTNGFAPRDIVELCRTAFYKAVSKDAPVTLDLLLRQAALLGTSPAQGRNGKTVPMKADSTMRLLEFTNHVNGHSAKKAAV